MFCHSSREKNGVRFWWHLGSNRACVHAEIYWWSKWCHAGVSCDDEGWTLKLAFPPIAIWLVFDNLGLWLPQRKAVASWENPPREIWLPDQRECQISFYDWTIRLNPWSKSMEWTRSDPWWVRGVSLDLRRLLLGRERCDTSIVREGIPVVVPMPEGNYNGVVKIERRTWKRPRWFARTRESAWLEIPKGIPHAGKGENSWDCGDDGLFGIGGDSIEDAIANAVRSVMRDRKRYGSPSPQSITDALSASR